MFCKDYDSFISLLSRRNYTVHTARDGAQARDILLSLVPEGSTAGFGGSMTAKELCLAEALRGKGCTTYFHWEAPAEERGEVTRRAARADWFIASANGVTRSGKIVNIDGTGNRIAAMCYGPGTVYVLIGRNKIVSGGYAQAVKRIKEFSCPLNARRFQLHNPCAETGRCNPAECEKPICHVIASFERAPNGKRTQVILINESLGY